MRLSGGINVGDPKFKINLEPNPVNGPEDAIFGLSVHWQASPTSLNGSN